MALALVMAAPLAADDRDLLRSAGKAPSMFILLDTSGSMNWALTGGFFPGDADPPTAVLPGSADDPRSRGYQAKSAIYEVIKDLPPDTRLGFAHFSSPNSLVTRKHWLYTPAAGTVVPWAAELPFPLPGQPLLFGDQSFGSDLGSCGAPDAAFNPAGPDHNAHRIDRMSYFPKLGQQGNQPTALVTERGGVGLSVEFVPLSAGQELGDDELLLDLRFRNCSSGQQQNATIRFVPAQPADDLGIPLRGASGVVSQNFFALGFPLSEDYLVGSPCGGWEDNSGTADGQLAYRTFDDPLGRGTTFSRGDVVPWDWVDHASASPPPAGFELNPRDEFLRRLAPNVYYQVTLPDGTVTYPLAPTFAALGVTPQGNYEPTDRVPDFRIAPYLEDQPDGSGTLPVRSEFRDTPPIAFGNSTPLAAMLDDLRDWYQAWESVAENDDPEFSCRKRFAILLTDGVETCGGDPTTAASSLRAAGVQTFAVGFGPVGSGALRSIAREGGTGKGTYFINEPDAPPGISFDCQRFRYTARIDTDADGTPDTDEERDTCDDPATADDEEGVLAATSRAGLVEVLSRILFVTRGKESAFAGASLPAQQAGSTEAIVLSSFLPLPEEPYWRGQLNYFARPLPLTVVDGRTVPDTTRLCPSNPSPTNPAVRCFAWDAGAAMLSQAPTDSEVATDILRLGLNSDQRRLYWSRQPAGDAVPRQRQWFVSPPDDNLALRYDLYNALDIPFVVGDSASETAAALRTAAVIEGTVVRKRALDPRAANPQTAPQIEYILGDIFHSNPFFLGAPLEFTYARQNLNDNGEPCIEAGGLNPDALGYRCFFQKHRQRRKVVLVGANDAQLHALDAGRWDRTAERFTLGSGRELFGYLPGPLLPRTREIAEGAERHEYGVDGSVQVADVFVDPVHTGTPQPADRQWRTVVLGGLREGGPGYYALDVTQPDPVSLVDGVEVPDDLGSYLPACAGAAPGDGDGLSQGLNSACGPVPYATPLWEFTDQRDDDGNGSSDLGATWSQPNTGRIRVRVGTDVVDKFVAVFGGGFDPEDTSGVGNWLYLVDIETGFAIYKRPLIGAAAADPAAVDTNFDGFLDRIYVGTTAGVLYKADLSQVVELEDDATVPGGKTVADLAWQPFPFFDTGGRPIFHPPAVVFVAAKSRYAVAFATGDRDQLFTRNGVEGRFYIVLDDNFTAVDLSAGALAEGVLQSIDASSSLEFGDLLLDPASGNGTVAGYALGLAANERGISRAFALSGVLVFSTFTPSSGTASCGGRGVSRVYTLFSTSGNALSGTSRFRELDTFVSNPFTETSGIGESGSQSDSGEDELSDDLLRIQDILRGLMPANCRFNNIRIDIKVVREDTGVEFVAPVPVCVVLKNWKEF